MPATCPGLHALHFGPRREGCHCAREKNKFGGWVAADRAAGREQSHTSDPGLPQARDRAVRHAASTAFGFSPVRNHGVRCPRGRVTLSRPALPHPLAPTFTGHRYSCSRFEIKRAGLRARLSWTLKLEGPRTLSCLGTKWASHVRAGASPRHTVLRARRARSATKTRRHTQGDT